MCGIAGYVGKEKAVDMLLPMMKALEYRGYDSAGIAVQVDKDFIEIRKGCGYLDDVIETTNMNKSEGTIGIGHVRWATHGKVSPENAHPHYDRRGKIVVVHNGVIENYLELKAGLRDKDSFRSETDTEVIAYLLSETLGEGPYMNPDMAYAKALKVVHDKLEGDYAIAVMGGGQANDKIYVLRHNMPVILGKGDGEYFLASDILAFGPRVNQVAECPDDTLIELSRDGIKTCWGVDPVWGPLGKYRQDSTKKNYPHYMIKEIMEQPEVWRQALMLEREQITACAIDILRAKDVIWGACGTSRFASVVGRYLMSGTGGKFTEVIPGSELHYFEQAFNQHMVLIAVSQSGETADVVNGARKVKNSGGEVLSIINRPMSMLSNLSDRVLYMNCGAEIGVAATKSFIATLAVIYQLVYMMAGTYDEKLPVLDKLTAVIEETLTCNKYTDIADHFANQPSAYYLSKGINYAVAGECALKLKEISYIHAESVAAGELKHGILALVEDGTPVVGICPSDYTRGEVIVSMAEAKARGAYVVGISDKNDPVFDAWLRIPEVEGIYYPVPLVIVGQLLAYHVAVRRGFNPDKPRNLAKSVTVK